MEPTREECKECEDGERMKRMKRMKRRGEAEKVDGKESG